MQRKDPAGSESADESAGDEGSHEAGKNQRSSGSNATPDLAENTKPRPTHFEIRTTSGQVIDMQADSRIHKNTTIQWVFRKVARATKWPLDYMTIVIGDTFYRYSRVKNGAQEMEDLTLWCVLDHMQENGAYEVTEILTMYVTFQEPPSSFDDATLAANEPHRSRRDRRLGKPALCICDFSGHGCCIRSREDHMARHCHQRYALGPKGHWGCLWCGNNATCRSGACIHECCRSEMQTNYMQSRGANRA